MRTRAVTHVPLQEHSDSDSPHVRPRRPRMAPGPGKPEGAALGKWRLGRNGPCPSLSGTAKGR